MNDFVLFSTQSQAAEEINKKYYNDVHFVYCAAEYNPVLSAASSRPKWIYDNFEIISKTDDRHNPIYIHHKAKLRYGADKKFRRGEITDAIRRDIYQFVCGISALNINPRIYLINMKAIQQRSALLQVSPTHSGSATSVEYKILELTRGEFITVQW